MEQGEQTFDESPWLFQYDNENELDGATEKFVDGDIMNRDNYYYNTWQSSSSSSSSYRQFARMIAGASTTEGPTRIDYSVLSVVVMTLGLIMVVEVLRHRLDMIAFCRPFFKAVLEGVYTELSTLGMVEFFIWLLHSYYEGLDVAKESVFAKVHFALFYTAILTAFQTVIVAFFANRVSHHLWIRTEAIELNHYVEIREEFQTVSNKLQKIARQRQERRRHLRGQLFHTNRKLKHDNSGKCHIENSPDKKVHIKGSSSFEGKSEVVCESQRRHFKDESNHSLPNSQHFDTDLKTPMDVVDKADGAAFSDSTTQKDTTPRSCGSDANDDDNDSYADRRQHDVAIKKKSSKINLDAETRNSVNEHTGTGDHNTSCSVMAAIIDEDDGKNNDPNKDISTSSDDVLYHPPRSSHSNCCVGVCFSLHYFGRSVWDSIRYPHLKRKYNQLLVQVRFHELRVHFLQAYKLPLKLKISDYLLRSQLAVLIRLVHVSMAAWLMLTGVTNLLYFIMGIVSYKTANPEFVAAGLEALYFASMAAFVFMAIAIHIKMKQIFKRIMHQEVLWDIQHDEAEKKALAEKQLALFWFSDPTIVIAGIQFIQFCYAISVSVVLIFWHEIFEGHILMRYYWISALVSYAVFVYVVAKVIPRYTLCTSLGQLVNEQRLHETLSLFRLQEARLQILEDLHYKNTATALAVSPFAASSSAGERPTRTLPEHGQSKGTHVSKSIGVSSIPRAENYSAELQQNPPVITKQRSKSPGAVIGSAFTAIKDAAMSVAAPALESMDEPPVQEIIKVDNPVAVTQDRHSAEIMAELVRQKDTSSLRTSLPAKEFNALKAREEREKRLLERRRNRRKSVSDGVSAMARPFQPLVGPLSAGTESADKARMMAKDDSGLFGGNSSNMVFSEERSILGRISPSELKPDDTKPESLRERRRRRGQRMKSISDGVALMCKMNDGVPFPSAAKTPDRSVGQVDPRKNGSPCASQSPSFFNQASWRRRTGSNKVPLEGSTVTIQTRDTGTFEPHNQPTRIKDDSDLAIANRKTKMTLNEPHWGANAESLNPDDTKPESLQARRLRRGGRRQKSVSDGVALMGSLFSGNVEPIMEEKTSEDADVFDVVGSPNARTNSDHQRASNVLIQSASSVASLDSSEAGPVPISPELLSLPYIIKPVSEHAVIPETPHEEESESSYVPDSLRSFVDEADKTLRESKKKFLLGAESRVDTPDSFPSDLKTPRSLEVHGHEEKEEDEDATSILSTESVGGLSDANDIPDIDPLFANFEDKKASTLRELLRAYYLSSRYALISNVFGTIVAFFLIGQRIEGFLDTEDIASRDEFVSFGFPLEVTFWLLFTWFILFLLTSAFIFWTIDPFHQLGTNKERALFFSAVIDSLLTIVCLACLTVAEVQRCCTTKSIADTHLRDLAEGYSTERDEQYSGQYKESQLPVCNCPSFGSRTYGGYGLIEPFTSLVALRVLRHWVAKSLVAALETCFAPASDAADFKATLGIKADPFAVFGDKHSKKIPMSEERGTIVDLWQFAVSRYPDIVSEHGEFSGELLRAMLGVPNIPGRVKPQLKHNHFSPEQNTLISGHRDHQPGLSEHHYSSLSPQTQESIIAGKTGISQRFQNERVDALDNIHPTIPEDEEAFHDHQHFASSNLLSMHCTSSDQLQHLEIHQSESTFAAPNARLIRNMRRCDRKLLPVLDTWNVVDVVLTRHEVIYFDSIEADTAIVVPGSPVEGMKQALKATKGGKGLRLIDVSVGRRVAGQLQLTDIISVHVERELPHQLRPGDHDGPAIGVGQSEYWHKRTMGEHVLDIGTRWSAVKQDVLRLKTVTGRTVCLRFYSDLDDAEAHPDRLVIEKENEGLLYKNLAFQWAQTIVRLCGPEQLKQPLPHLGDDTSDELRDFLLVKPDDRKDAPRHRRVFSDGGDVFNYFHRPKQGQNTEQIPRPRLIGVRSSSAHAVPSAGMARSFLIRKRSFHHMGELSDRGEDSNSPPLLENAGTKHVGFLEGNMHYGSDPESGSVSETRTKTDVDLVNAGFFPTPTREGLADPNQQYENLHDEDATPPSSKKHLGQNFFFDQDNFSANSKGCEINAGSLSHAVDEKTERNSKVEDDPLSFTSEVPTIPSELNDIFGDDQRKSPLASTGGKQNVFPNAEERESSDVSAKPPYKKEVDPNGRHEC